MAKSINDGTLTQIEQRVDSDVAMRSSMGVVNRRIQPSIPIIVVLDEARVLGLDHLHIKNAEPQQFGRPIREQLDSEAGYDIFPFEVPQEEENRDWEDDIIELRRVLDAFDATDAAWWNDRYRLSKPNLQLVMVQPVAVETLDYPQTPADYFAVGSLPSRGINSLDAEWGCLPLSRNVLVKQAGESSIPDFDDVQVNDKHPIIYRQVQVPIVMEPIHDPVTREFLYNVPAAKWSKKVLDKAIPGGITTKTIQALGKNPLEDRERRVYVCTEPDYGWFRRAQQLGFVPHRSSWLRIVDQTDEVPTKRSPLRQIHESLRRTNIDNDIDVNQLSIPDEHWIRAFSHAVALLMANFRNEPTSTGMVGAGLVP